MQQPSIRELNSSLFKNSVLSSSSDSGKIPQLSLSLTASNASEAILNALEASHEEEYGEVRVLTQKQLLKQVPEMRAYVHHSLSSSLLDLPPSSSPQSIDGIKKAVLERVYDELADKSFEIISQNVPEKSFELLKDKKELLAAIPELRAYAHELVGKTVDKLGTEGYFRAKYKTGLPSSEGITIEERVERKLPGLTKITVDKTISQMAKETYFPFGSSDIPALTNINVLENHKDIRKILPVLQPHIDDAVNSLEKTHREKRFPDDNERIIPEELFASPHEITKEFFEKPSFQRKVDALQEFAKKAGSHKRMVNGMTIVKQLAGEFEELIDKLVNKANMSRDVSEELVSKIANETLSFIAPESPLNKTDILIADQSAQHIPLDNTSIVHPNPKEVSSLGNETWRDIDLSASKRSLADDPLEKDEDLSGSKRIFNEVDRTIKSFPRGNDISSVLHEDNSHFGDLSALNISMIPPNNDDEEEEKIGDVVVRTEKIPEMLQPPPQLQKEITLLPIPLPKRSGQNPLNLTNELHETTQEYHMDEEGIDKKWSRDPNDKETIQYHPDGTVSVFFEKKDKTGTKRMELENKGKVNLHHAFETMFRQLNERSEERNQILKNRLMKWQFKGRLKDMEMRYGAGLLKRKAEEEANAILNQPIIDDFKKTSSLADQVLFETKQLGRLGESYDHHASFKDNVNKTVNRSRNSLLEKSVSREKSLLAARRFLPSYKDKSDDEVLNAFLAPNIQDMLRKKFKPNTSIERPSEIQPNTQSQITDPFEESLISSKNQIQEQPNLTHFVNSRVYSKRIERPGYSYLASSIDVPSSRGESDPVINRLRYLARFG
jgi:hypothetical protein